MLPTELFLRSVGPAQAGPRKTGPRKRPKIIGFVFKFQSLIFDSEIETKMTKRSAEKAVWK